MEIGPEHPRCLSTAQCCAQPRYGALLQKRSAALPAVDETPEHGCIGDEQLNRLADDPACLLSWVLLGGEGEARVKLAKQRVAKRCPLLLSRSDEVEDRRGGEVRERGDALDGRCLARTLAQQLPDRVEDPLTALALVALAQACSRGRRRHPTQF